MGNNNDSSSSSSSSSSTTSSQRSPPNAAYFPTALEAAVLLAYPVLLVFGHLFALLSPNVRNAPYDATLQAHAQAPDLAPSYFARKSNLFNILFVKRGWAWISLSFLLFLFTHPTLATASVRRRALTRWALVTGWWLLVTQWCFGAALMDRGFRWTGGQCEVSLVDDSVTNAAAAKNLDLVASGAACKAAGGHWRGGHDSSGHVFLLVLGSYFLLQEVGWVYIRQNWGGRNGGASLIRDERRVVMQDGAIKGAAVEAELVAEAVGLERRVLSAWDALGLGGKFAVGVVALSWWMILMTAIYFHTWFEKVRWALCFAFLVGRMLTTINTLW